MAPPKRPWFRMYVEIFADKKIRRQTVATRWLCAAVFGAARQSPITGYLMVSEQVPMTVADIADYAALSRKQVTAGLDALTEMGITAFDEHLGAWWVTKFLDRQYESDMTANRPSYQRHKADNVTPPENREQKTYTSSSGGTSTAVVPTRTPKGSVVAIRREAAAVLDLAASLCNGRPILQSERDNLWATIDEALRAGVDRDDLARAVASSPFRTPKGVLGELGKRGQKRGSVGDDGLHAAAEWLQRRGGDGA